ncbi:MAG TPA: peptidoglycan DD-metalloendopeptidase family protein [Povalibacter sp.]
MLLVALLLSIAACAGKPTQSGTYTVKRGDTLYSIAWKHRIDYHDLARWNGIGRDYVIHPGQILRLSSGGRVAKTTAPSKTAPPTKRPPQARVPAPLPLGPPIPWQWPVDAGKATLTTRPNGGQGLTIDGRSGQDIRAAGGGRVVYTGTGLLGYGQLVIIKHSETYLSAYGHTQSVAVREGDPVTRGQRIATMGNGPQGTPMLYFEIRINGTPGNPLLLLPQRR